MRSFLKVLFQQITSSLLCFVTGKWLHTFDKRKTIRFPFYVTKNKKITTKMMMKQIKVPYVESELLKAKAISLSFKPKKFSLVVILPKQKHKIDVVEMLIKNYGLHELFSGNFLLSF